jgi:hypothetical protein
MLADSLFKTLFTSGRIVSAIIVIAAVTAINFTWVRTVPNCVTSGYGTAHYSGKDESALGCWPAAVTREKLRERAFEEWARESERAKQLGR